MSLWDNHFVHVNARGSNVWCCHIYPDRVHFGALTILQQGRMHRLPTLVEGGSKVARYFAQSEPRTSLSRRWMESWRAQNIERCRMLRTDWKLGALRLRI